MTNTKVFLDEPMDLGVGESDSITFVGCGWHVDEAGTLHIIGRNRSGNVAAFGKSYWVAVVDDGFIRAENS